MKKPAGGLFLNDRFFYAMAAIIVLFLVSYTISPVFYLASLSLAAVTIILISEGFSLYRRKNITIERILASVFSLHDANEVKLFLKNERTFTVHLRIIDELPFQLNKRDLLFRLKVQGGENQTLSYHLTPVVRGAYRFGNIQVFVSTGLQFLSRRETTQAETEVAVYPSIMQMARQQLIALNHPAFTSGGNKNRRLGQSYEFDQIKAYVPGDDTRNINWKASSTMREIMVNVYEDERSQQVYSIIDKSRVMKTPFAGLALVDHAINATLAFSNIVLKKQDKAGLLIFSKNAGSMLKAERGTRQLKKIMYSLYREEYDYSEADFELLYSTIRRNIPNRSLLFLYTNFETLQAFERNLSILRLINKYHLLVLVFFNDTELEAFAREEASNLLEIYQVTIAKRFLFEKKQIERELERHGILSIRCNPEQLSTATINKYLELKEKGRF